jgi:hypothetical protein
MTQADRVIVTVRLDGTDDARDLDVPVTMPATRLGASIAVALGWPEQAYAVWAEPPGRALADHETLADAGAWDGAQLTLRPGGQSIEAAQASASPPGYVWKRLDRD